MNNYYLVPMWKNENNQIKNHLVLIKAQNRYQAMLIAIGSHSNMNGDSDIVKDSSYTDWHVDMNYKLYQECKSPKEIFTYMNIGVTIKRNNETQETEDMGLFNVNWNDYKDAILKEAIPEIWSNDTYPDNGMLVNYMVHTFKKLKSEKKVIETKEYGLFNTGLFTEFYQPIFAYAAPDKSLSFMTPYELGSIGIDEYPERANYFEDPSLLLFDWHYKINVHYKHILDEINNIKRLPENMQKNKNILNSLNGSIETMKKRVSANYKLAIPQYFDNKIQLLLPLCLQSDDIPDLALVVTKVGNVYQGHTCLTLDMAYNNARLIAKPESNWLNANNK